MAQYYTDDYYHDRPRRPRMASQMGGGVYHLSPTDPYVVGDLHRSRSHGHVRAPDVHIYNDINAQARADPVTVAPPSPRGRRVDLVDIGYQAMYRPYSYSRSRSRSKSRDRIIADYRREQDDHERDKQRAIADYENKRAADAKAAKDAQEEAVRKWKMEEEKRKEEEEEGIRKYKALEQKKKDDEKANEEAVLLKIKLREEEEKGKKKKADEEYEERVRKDLARFGFQENQIKAMVKSDEEKKKELLAAAASGTALTVRGLGAPVFPKIRRRDIAVETLKYYGLPWEYDPKDGDFIIILQEMSERQTDVLFAHTRRLRERTTLFIEDRGRDKPQYQFVRRKSRGKSPRREKVVTKLFGA